MVWSKNDTQIIGLDGGVAMPQTGELIGRKNMGKKLG